jgi:hypothetical protein
VDEIDTTDLENWTYVRQKAAREVREDSDSETDISDFELEQWDDDAFEKLVEDREEQEEEEGEKFFYDNPDNKEMTLEQKITHIAKNSQRKTMLMQKTE